MKKKSHKSFRLLIAGGGTGGHLFPGIAVGRELLRREPGAEILFVTAGREIESHILKNAGFRQASVNIEGIKGQDLKKAIKGVLKLPLSFFRSFYIVKKFSPDIVLGVGGYSSGPVCMSAWVMRIPIAIHEQNSFPGLTNRLLARIVNRVFTSFEDSKVHFGKSRVFFSGNPIRKEFFDKHRGQGKGEKKFTILVSGGSQGASAIK